MLLTKRPQNISKMLPTPEIDAAAWGAGWPNVWLGTTIEDRERLTNLDHLRAVPAAIRFLSIEPLLEDLGAIDLTGIHLVIVGGESGLRARPMHPAWVRQIRDACAGAGLAYLFKQCGSWAPEARGRGWMILNAEGSLDVPDDRWPAEEAGEVPVTQVGKKAAGRLLNGVEHNGMPTLFPLATKA